MYLNLKIIVSDPTTDQTVLDPEDVKVNKVVSPSKGLGAQQGLRCSGHTEGNEYHRGLKKASPSPLKSHMESTLASGYNDSSQCSPGT